MTITRALFPNFNSFAILVGIFLSITLLLPFSVFAQPTAACENLAHSVSGNIRPALENQEYTGSQQDARIFYNTWKKLQLTPDIIDGGNVFTNFTFTLNSADNGWVLIETVTDNTPDQNSIVLEHRQEDGDQLPVTFALSTAEADFLSEIRLDQPNTTWDDDIVRNMSSVISLQEGGCNLDLSVDDILDQVYASADANPPVAEDPADVDHTETLPEIEWETSFDRVPKPTLETPLSVRLKSRAGDITIFGVDIEDIKNGTANPDDFQIEGGSINLGSIFSDIGALFRGNRTVGGFDMDLFGIQIDNVEFYYDFYYSIDATINLQDADYDRVDVYFARRGNRLSLMNDLRIASLSGSQTMNISENVYNSRSNPGLDDSIHSYPMSRGQFYYIRIEGIRIDDNDNELTETITVRRLPRYTTTIDDIEYVTIEWDDALMSTSQNGPEFTLSGSLISTSNFSTPLPLKLFFGSGRRDYKSVWNIASPTASFSRTISDVYFSQDDISQNRPTVIQPNTLYYASLSEGNSIVSFVQAGRTPDAVITKSEVEDTVDSEEEADNPSDPRPDPIAELEKRIDGGLVPCTGADCDYNAAIQLVSNIINYVFILIIPISAIAFVYAGSLMLFSGSNPNKRSQAKDIFLKVVIGIVIILSAFLIVKIIFTSLGATNNIEYLPLDL